MTGHLRQIYEDDDRPWVDLLQVCERGHKITAYGKSQPDEMKDFCPHCGAKTLVACPTCRTELQGYKHIPNVIYYDTTTPPMHCSKCGADFPWTAELEARKKAGSKRPPLDSLCILLQRFPLVARQLRSRHDSRSTLEIEDEYDVQDLLHALFRIEFDDIRPEEWTPSYAGGSSRMDFLLKSEQIVVEAKKTRKGMRDKDLGEQLIVDVAKYESHPDCRTLVCFIHDPENRIGNPAGLVADLESKSTDRLQVRIIIA
ncbi:MAG: DUF2321 domain-containing protein [Phycisphaerales bacterium]|nr:DUF2321 domain-containing protein [Phycisphaerales bacterium]